MVIVTESWLSDVVSDAMIVGNNNYSVHRDDRAYAKGGGVCIVASNASPMKCIRVCLSAPDVALLAKSRCEFACLDVIFSDSKFRFISLYRPPNSSFESSLTLLNCSQALSQLLINLTIS